MDHPIFSIMICHTTDREDYLKRLLACLQPQIDALPDPSAVEVLVETDAGEANGGMTTGQKRNVLVQKSSGDFAAFIDDDDLVVDTYVSDILGAIAKDPTVDCIGMKGIISWKGERPTVFVHSITCSAYTFDGEKFLRTPNHLNPVATRISKKVSYRDITKDEDRQWCFAVKPYLKTETMIEHPIYRYLSRGTCGLA